MRKARLPLVIATVCVCIGAIAGIPALASGAAAPTVSSSPASNVTNSSATLNGTVNPNGVQTSYALQWGPTTGYGHETPVTSAGAGTAAAPVSATVSGLAAGTAYHFRVIAFSSAGTAVGNDESFTTTGTAPAPSAAPTATTAPASNVTASSATLNGAVNPGGQATTDYFEYGTTGNYGLQTAPQPAGSGTASESASVNITGLASGTTIHYRLVATSAGGTALGADQTLTTSSSSGGPVQSHVDFMGHMGFVSPGAVIGVEAGCFGGDTTCSGHVTMSVARSRIVIGQRNFSIGPRSGGFQNIKLSPYGNGLVRHNGVWRLLQIDVVVTTTTGQRTSERMSLARWVWH